MSSLHTLKPGQIQVICCNHICPELPHLHLGRCIYPSTQKHSSVGIFVQGSKVEAGQRWELGLSCLLGSELSQPGDVPCHWMSQQAAPQGGTGAVKGHNQTRGPASSFLFIFHLLFLSSLGTSSVPFFAFPSSAVNSAYIFLQVFKISRLPNTCKALSWSATWQG